MAARQPAEIIFQKTYLPPLTFQEKPVHNPDMVEFRYRGREISRKDILSIRALIDRHSNESRRKLSTALCETWQWRQGNGALRDMVCCGLLLMLERAGQIQLPPVSYVRHNPLAIEPGRSRHGSISHR